MSLIEDIKRDRETGTPGPWWAGHFADDTHRCECKYLFAEYGGMGSLADFNVGDNQFSNEGPPKVESAANARRCARVPDLEAALLDAVAAIEWLSDEAKYDKLVTGYAQAALAQITEGRP